LQELSAKDLEVVSKDYPQLLVEMVNVARARAEQIGEDRRLAELRKDVQADVLACRFSRRLLLRRPSALASDQPGGPAGSCLDALHQPAAASSPAEGATHAPEEETSLAARKQSSTLTPNPEAMEQFLAKTGREPHEHSVDHTMLDVQLERLILSHNEVIQRVQSLSKGQDELRQQLLLFLSSKEQPGTSRA